MKKIGMYRVELNNRYVDPFVKIDENKDNFISNNADFDDMINIRAIKEFANDMIEREDYIAPFIEVGNPTDNEYKGMYDTMISDENIRNMFLKLYNIDVCRYGIYGEMTLIEYLRLNDRICYDEELIKLGKEIELVPTIESRGKLREFLSSSIDKSKKKDALKIYKIIWGDLL